MQKDDGQPACLTRDVGEQVRMSGCQDVHVLQLVCGDVRRDDGDDLEGFTRKQPKTPGPIPAHGRCKEPQESIQGFDFAEHTRLPKRVPKGYMHGPQRRLDGLRAACVWRFARFCHADDLGQSQNAPSFSLALLLDGDSVNTICW